MSLRINQNVTSLFTYSNLNRTSTRLEQSIGRLSSGLRINSAADDASGLAISEKMRSQIRGLAQAEMNAQDAMSMLHTAEGALNETHNMLHRMREMAIKASNDTLTTGDRLEIQKEINQLKEAIDGIAQSTEFNTKKLLDGSQTALVSSSSNYVKGIVGGAAASQGDFAVNLELVEGGVSQMQASQMFTKRSDGTLADANTKLEDIAEMYDKTGTFIIGSGKKLTVTGNAKSVDINVDAKMTLNELAASLQNALSNSTTGLGLTRSKVEVVGTVHTGVANLGGYLELTSGSTGDIGEFSIAGDQAVTDALGISVTRASSNNLVDVTLMGSNGESRVVRTSSNRASGLLEGIDVQFASQAAQVASKGVIRSGLHLEAANNFTINVTDNLGAVTAVNLSVAAGDWSMEGIARSLNESISAAPALEGMKAGVVDGEIRLSFNPPRDNIMTSFVVSNASSATDIGITDGKYNGFLNGEKNLDSEIKGYSLYGSAATALTMQVSDGVDTAAVNFGTQIVDPQTADLREIKDFLYQANTVLSTADVDVQMDMVNGSIVATSKHIGKLNVDGAPALDSKIVLSGISVTTSRVFGFDDGTVTGCGDTNFRLHVVNNQPHFQIGANAGQNMSINIGNMSTLALGIDKLDMNSVKTAQEALGKIDSAINKVSTERSKIGAYENRLRHSVNTIQNASTNTTAAESRIRDADMAKEMIEFTSSQILMQSGTAMLAQANMVPQNVLQLLGS